jgi:hypothetical protein
MTTEDRLLGSPITSDQRERLELLPREQPSGFIDWLRLFLLRRRINAMLKRTVGPVRYEPAARLPPHLLRDIGLNPPM